MADLASRIIAAMRSHGYAVATGPDEMNIVYVEGMGPDGSVNDDAPNKFNDARFLIKFVNGQPVIAGAWEATTSPGKYWVTHRMNPRGAAHIAFGQYAAWKVGVHNGSHEALVQTGGPVTVYRDDNEDFKRDGDATDTGYFGINQHWGYDLPRDDLGTSSAGCLVGRTKAGHREFMRLVKLDPRYLRDGGSFTFSAAVLPAGEVAGAIKPTGQPMALQLTAGAMLAMFPKAPQAILDAFVAKQSVLDAAGITASVNRLAYFFANIHHEVGGFTIRGLTENINYTAARAAQVWPNRFGSASEVAARYGTAPGWQLRMFDDVYGSRMGNRPGTSDGSRFIGRGGPQWTGRDGYEALQRLTGLPAVAQPEVAAQPDKQPEVCAAFWSWKNMNPKADAGDFRAVVKAWNGGYNGLTDREAQLARILPIVRGLKTGTAAAPPEPSKPTSLATKMGIGAGIAAALGWLVHWLGAHWPLTIGVVLIAAAVAVLIARKGSR